MDAIRISYPTYFAIGIKLESNSLSVACYGACSAGESKSGRTPMTDLENKLNNLLEEHQHESGLHMIGGRRRLIDRLVQFFEQDVKKAEVSAQSSSREH